jgi:beta-glucanase (GH16 family)
MFPSVPCRALAPSDCSVCSIDFCGSVLTTGSYADDFHTFAVEWTKTGIYYYVDNVYIGGVTPPNPGGFWSYGGFTNATNIWANGTNPVMTPFDQNVTNDLKYAKRFDCYFQEKNASFT